MLARLFAPDHGAQPNLNVAPPQPPELVLGEVQRNRRTGTVRDLVAGEANRRVA